MTVAPTDLTYSVYTRPHSSQNLWVDREDASPEVPFRVTTVPQLVVSPPMVAPGFCDHWGYLIMTDMVWTSGAARTSRHGHRCRDTLALWWSIPWPSDPCGSGVQSSHTRTTPRFSVCLVHLGGQSLGHFSQHHLHLRKMNINQAWRMAELRKESHNV